MLFRRSCVAESFNTTPRAPSCRASTICFFSAAAVSRIMRTNPWFEVVLISRSASSPCWRGMAKSRSRMSGFSWRASFTASAPSQASPITFRSDSVSSNLRKPSRKIGWSSAMTMRIGSDLLLSIGGFSSLRYANFQSGATAWGGLYSQNSVNQVYPLTDHNGASTCRFKFNVGQSSGEWKAATVIFYCKLPGTSISGQLNNNTLRVAVFAHIHERLLHNVGDFAANLLLHIQQTYFGMKTGKYSGFPLEPFDRITQEWDQAFGVHIERLHLLHQLTQL